MEHTKFLRLLCFLKKNIKLDHGITVRRIRMPRGYDGDCRLTDKGFLIRIEKSFPEHFAIDILLHEYAHALAWDKESDVHGPTWGRAYSTVYRKYLEWNDN